MLLVLPLLLLLRLLLLLLLLTLSLTRFQLCAEGGIGPVIGVLGNVDTLHIALHRIESNRIVSRRIGLKCGAGNAKAKKWIQTFSK